MTTILLAAITILLALILIVLYYQLPEDKRAAFRRTLGWIPVWAFLVAAVVSTIGLAVWDWFHPLEGIRYVVIPFGFLILGAMAHDLLVEKPRNWEGFKAGIVWLVGFAVIWYWNPPYPSLLHRGLALSQDG